MQGLQIQFGWSADPPFAGLNGNFTPTYAMTSDAFFDGHGQSFQFVTHSETQQHLDAHGQSDFFTGDYVKGFETVQARDASETGVSSWALFALGAMGLFLRRRLRL